MHKFNVATGSVKNQANKY